MNLKNKNISMVKISRESSQVKKETLKREGESILSYFQNVHDKKIIMDWVFFKEGKCKSPVRIFEFVENKINK